MHIFHTKSSSVFAKYRTIYLKFLSLMVVFLATACTTSYDSAQNERDLTETTVTVEETETEDQNIVLFEGVEDEGTVEAINEQELTEQILNNFS